MKILESAENYLETVLILKKQLGEVRAVDIANHLNFSKPSVSAALKQFRENGLITIGECGFIALTKSGMEIAVTMYERHKILANFLIGLGVNENTASEDACRIEHYISDESFQKIKEHCIGCQKFAQEGK